MIDLAATLADARKTGDYGPLSEAIPYCQFLGMRARLVGECVRIHVPFQPSLIGNVTLPSIHGGIVGACLETAALLQLIHERARPPLPRTIDFTVDYLRAARPEDLFAQAEVQRSGRRVANVRMCAFQQDATQPIALGRGNFLLD